MSYTAPFPAQPTPREAAAIEALVVPHPMLGQPAFERLHRMRRRFSWTLTAAMLAIYFGFILTLAFRPAWLAVPVTPGRPMTLGIPVGFGMFAVTFALVAVYVYRSNVTFDSMITAIRAGEQA
ncbi:DUF485 domain-containing protein [Cupriavidus necator]|uniref:DUF485 domain-containing protein n=1 Tax=Cupriavidus necator TaxID=106590 RepID=UPI00339D38E4